MIADKMIEMTLLRKSKHLGNKGDKIKVFSENQAEYFESQNIATRGKTEPDKSESATKVETETTKKPSKK